MVIDQLNELYLDQQQLNNAVNERKRYNKKEKSFGSSLYETNDISKDHGKIEGNGCDLSIETTNNI